MSDLSRNLLDAPINLMTAASRVGSNYAMIAREGGLKLLFTLAVASPLSAAASACVQLAVEAVERRMLVDNNAKAGQVRLMLTCTVHAR